MDHDDSPDQGPSRGPLEGPVPDDVSDAPTVQCSACEEEWDLTYELDELRAGNRAVEQFALDHYRHTGHYPDDVTPWVASCRQCPTEESYLEGRPARRFGETHARHTLHSVDIVGPDEDQRDTIEPDAVRPRTGSPENPSE